MYETVVPPLDEGNFEKTVTPIVQEYFEHGDTNEVAVSVQETHCATEAEIYLEFYPLQSAIKITRLEPNHKACTKLTSLSTCRSCSRD